uniref:Polymerase nucleotidyl transferase domain-containing protein n=1 Tax=Meloidogyne javanica TaxID=6303 RepID=A0A915M217_MELJA
MYENDKKAEILESNTKSLPEKPEMIEQKINIESKLIEKPSTTTKAKLSKKKRDQEKKKNLELKNLEKKSVEEISDNKMEKIEGEGEDTINEDVEEKLEGTKIEEQKQAEKPIMNNLEDKITKSSKGKGKTNVNKNIKAKPGKKDKKEVINKIIKEDDELKQNNELTVFVQNNELIDVLTEKKHWKNLRKSNFIIDRTVSLEEAIADIKKIVELWNKNAFTLISGSYLLNINSVESDVDFIVVLPFNYNDNNGKFVTKIMLDDEFMGIRSECNFEKREECSEKKSLYCVLCEVINN